MLLRSLHLLGPPLIEGKHLLGEFLWAEVTELVHLFSVPPALVLIVFTDPGLVGFEVKFRPPLMGWVVVPLPILGLPHLEVIDLDH